MLEEDKDWKPSETIQRYNKLEKEYIKRFRKRDWDDWAGQSVEEEIEALEICLKKGKRMRRIHPEWCRTGHCPRWMKM